MMYRYTEHVSQPERQEFSDSISQKAPQNSIDTRSEIYGRVVDGEETLVNHGSISKLIQPDSRRK